MMQLLTKMAPVFFAIYILSGVLYLTHCTLVWTHWSWAKKQTHPPLWIRSNMCWAMAGNGYFTLTNGRIVVHTLIAFFPVYNTGFVLASVGYALVDSVVRLWAQYTRPWSKV